MADGPTPTRLVIRTKRIPQEEIAEPVELKAQWRPVPLAIAAVLLLAIVAAGIYFFVGREDPPAAPRVATEVPVPRPAPPVEAQAPPAADARSAEPPPATTDAPPAKINEVIPVVARSARETIRGTIRVSVRVTI